MDFISNFDVATEWKIKISKIRKIPFYGYDISTTNKIAGIYTLEIQENFLANVEISVACTPKMYGVQNALRNKPRWENLLSRK